MPSWFSKAGGLGQDNEGETVVANPVAADRSIPLTPKTIRNVCFFDCTAYLLSVTIIHLVKPCSHQHF